VLKVAVAAFAAVALAGASTSALTPIQLHAGINPIPDIAGDGKAGSISVDWRENGNAWGYTIFMVRAGGSIATVDDADRFTDRPHTGEDVITSVRFARGRYKGRATTFALVAERTIVESVPAPAHTTIKIYALLRNDEPLGTPYYFLKLNEAAAKRDYCNADMALKTELGFPLPPDYSGPQTPDGC
jgi:hypothetical protein